MILMYQKALAWFICKNPSNTWFGENRGKEGKGKHQEC